MGWVGKHSKHSQKNPKKLVWGLAGLARQAAEEGLLDPSVATAAITAAATAAAHQILARIRD